MKDDARGCHGLVLRTMVGVLDAQTGSNVVGGGGGKTAGQQRGGEMRTGCAQAARLHSRGVGD